MAIEVSRIEREFILKNLGETQGKTEVLQGLNRVTATVRQVAGQEMRLDIQGGNPDELHRQSPAEIFFSFKGTRISGRTVVMGGEGRSLVVETPRSLYRDLSRNYERIQPEDSIGVSIQLDEKVLKLDFPVFQGEVSAVTPPEVNIKFDSAKIAELLRGFREKAKTFANEHKIVMFRERQPELITERMVAWSGKILMLPLSDAESPLKRREDTRADILKEQDVRAILKSSGANALALTQELGNHVDTMFQKKIWHEVYIPILYRQYVIGYVYLLRSDQQVNGFSPGVIEFVRQFSRILAYSLAANNYFTGIYQRERFDKSDLVDISASGLLFSVPPSAPAMDILNDLDLIIHVSGREIPVKARIMRRFTEAGRTFVGVKFLEMLEDDLSFLLEYLYGSEGTLMFTDESILPEGS